MVLLPMFTLEQSIDLEVERMLEIGFSDDKIQLCAADIRRGAIAAIQAVRFYHNCVSVGEFPRYGNNVESVLNYLEKWSEKND